LIVVTGGRVEVSPVSGFSGIYEPPPDKSISHRAAMLAALIEGRSLIKNFLYARDTLATLDCLRAVGVVYDEDRQNKRLTVESGGFFAFKEPEQVLDARNSATTMRLLAGLLSPLPHLHIFTGDKYLVRRPMRRIIEPLSLMGASIIARRGGYPPLAVHGGKLHGIEYRLRVASAQVKSAIIFAGLHAEGKTRIIEPVKTRDHTENMLNFTGISLLVDDEVIEVEPVEELKGDFFFEVPGDPSSAAFFVVAGLLAREGELKIKNVCLNPTRLGFVEVLNRAGAGIEVEYERKVSGEPVGTITVKAGRKLEALRVKPAEVPLLIDEIPILAIAASFAQGVSFFEGLAELKVKESNRLEAVAQNLKKMQVKVEVEGDNLRIYGGRQPRGAILESFGDHRIAMAFTVAALFASGSSVILNPECVDVSYPSFFADVSALLA